MRKCNMPHPSVGAASLKLAANYFPVLSQFDDSIHCTDSPK